MYWLVAAIMVVGALGSALSPSFWVLIVFRFVLGFGVGGDYPVSAVLMSQFPTAGTAAVRRDGVFHPGTRLIVWPLIALLLLGAGVSDSLAWRIMLGLGAIPAAAVVYLRRTMPESPRYQAQVQGLPAPRSSAWPSSARGGWSRHRPRPSHQIGCVV